MHLKLSNSVICLQGVHPKSGGCPTCSVTLFYVNVKCMYTRMYIPPVHFLSWKEAVQEGTVHVRNWYIVILIILATCFFHSLFEKADTWTYIDTCTFTTLCGTSRAEWFGQSHFLLKHKMYELTVNYFWKDSFLMYVYCKIVYTCTLYMYCTYTCTCIWNRPVTVVTCTLMFGGPVGKSTFCVLIPSAVLWKWLT